ncbi:MAG: sugar transferase [Anaerolineales bacterium]
MNSAKSIETTATGASFKKNVVNYRARTFLINLAGDVTALLFAVILAHGLLDPGTAFSAIYEVEHLLFAIICLSLLMTSRLYPGIGLNPAIEIKAIVQLTLVSFFIVFSFLMYQSPIWSLDKASLALNALFSLPLLLMLRWLVRIAAVQIGVWGEPVILIATTQSAAALVQYLHERRRLGFLPVLVGIADAAPSAFHHPLASAMSVQELLRLPADYFIARGISTALVSSAYIQGEDLSAVQRQLLKKFQRVIFVSEMDWLEGVSLNHYDLEGIFAIEVKQGLLTPPSAWFKRGIDIALSLTLGILALPLLLLSAILIKIEAPGPIFYRQKRLGKDRRVISIYKLRTMRENAEDALAAYLAENPAARQEWEHSQKLKHDPRITKVGVWLRKLSIDELPQLWNVLKGDMSIVGPRPILLEQADLYGEALRIYTRVRPGLTGFWQVSGRNRTSFSQRANFDVYYVRNWSIWLDIYILLRTVWVVLSRDGAS